MEKDMDKEALNEIIVCILAYNEQKHIANTIKHIMEGNQDIQYTLKVYANGCTDNTVQIVKDLEKTYPNLELRELKIAGKPNAWNTAFAENKTDILMFSDADIILEVGAIKDLADTLRNNTDFMAATALYTPHQHGLSLEKKFTGYMQLPIEQEYLTGHFYAIRRIDYADIFSKYNISGIPDGIVGEDYFIDLLVPNGKLAVSDKKCFYEPATLEETAKYFARLSWQGQQMKNLFETLGMESTNNFSQQKTSTLLKEKWSKTKNKVHFLSRLVPAIFRHLYLMIYKNKINKYYEDLGPVVTKGSHILIKTRSTSTK
ncbi:MAG: glycosyltransferase [Sulfurovum sp.]|nr:glycosyltransferase [Sulfurovum sp.]